MMRPASTVEPAGSASLLSGERKVLELIATRAPLQDILDTLCRVIDDLSGLRSSIFLRDKSGVCLTLAAGPHLPAVWRAAVASFPTTQTACGVAVTEGRQVVSPDISRDPTYDGFHAVAEAADIRAVWSTPFFSGYGGPLGTFAVYSDRTGPPSDEHLELVSHATHLASIAVDRYVSESALQESEIRFSRAFHANPAAMAIASFPDGRVTYVNDAFLSLIGYGRGEVIGQPTTLFIDHDRRSELVDCTANRGVHGVEMTVRTKSGDHCDVILSSERIDVLGESSALIIFIDVTELKRAQAEARRADEEARKAIDAIPVQIWSGPADGSVDYCNEQWRVYTGLRVDELQGDGWQRMVHPDDIDRVLVAWQTSVMTGTPYEQEERHRAADGTHRWFLCRGVPMRDAQGRITRWYGANMDITDRKQEENARRAAEVELAQSRDHLRTLAGKLMHTQDEERRRVARLLHETTAQDLAGLKMLLARLNRTSTALTDVERALVSETVHLADHVMTETRTLSYLLHPPFLDEAGLLSAIRWYADGFSKRSGIVVDLDLPPGLTRLPRDEETTLFRVVQEALINIHRHSDSQRATIRLRTNSGELVLEIGDEGRGIRPDVVARLNSDYSIVGVGLAGMRERLKQLGGLLRITSTSHGTTVRATVPFHQS